MAAAAIDTRAACRHETEQRLVAGAVLERRAEFATGRGLAHALLDDLGLPDEPLGSRPDRSPDWPVGVVGSISHTRSFAACACARSERFAALGLDLEEAQPLPADLWATVLGEPEQHAARNSPWDAGLEARLVFSAKECAYKTWSREMARVLEFEEVGIAIDHARQRFRALYLGAGPAPASGPALEGRFLRVDGLLVTGAVIRRDPSSPL